VEGEDSPANPVYATYDADGTLVGVAIPAAAQGYQDTIRALFGYDPEAGELTGYKVLESKETPGLGDQIGKNPDFLAQIEGMPVAVAEDGDGLAHAIETVKAGTKENPWEIDAIAGATISSEAVGVMLNEACQEVVPIIQRNLGRLAEAGVNNG
jgi:electron transport complex protein RnfG